MSKNKFSIPRGACTVVLGPNHTVLGVSRRGRPTEFGLPGGKIEPGETSRQAAVRETLEETGLVVRIVQKVYAGMCLGKGEIPHYTTYYLATAAGWAGPTKENGKVAWISWETLFEGPFGISNRAVYEALQEIVRNQHGE